MVQKTSSLVGSSNKNNYEGRIDITNSSHPTPLAIKGLTFLTTIILFCFLILHIYLHYHSWTQTVSFVGVVQPFVDLFFAIYAIIFGGIYIIKSTKK